MTVGPDAPLKHAARLLAEHSISALPVVDANDSLVGIVSEADLLPIETTPDPRTQARPLAPTAGSTPRSVAYVMTSRVITVQAGSEVSTAARLMMEAEVKRLPVMDGARLVGIISRSDLIKVIARHDADLRSELVRRLQEAGIGLTNAEVVVEDGVATIQLEDSGPNRRLAESVAITVSGVLEVRFRPLSAPPTASA